MRWACFLQCVKKVKKQKKKKKRKENADDLSIFAGLCDIVKEVLLVRFISYHLSYSMYAYYFGLRRSVVNSMKNVCCNEHYRKISCFDVVVMAGKASLVWFSEE